MVIDTSLVNFERFEEKLCWLPICKISENIRIYQFSRVEPFYFNLLTMGDMKILIEDK